MCKKTDAREKPENFTGNSRSGRKRRFKNYACDLAAGCQVGGDGGLKVGEEMIRAGRAFVFTGIRTLTSRWCLKTSGSFTGGRHHGIPEYKCLLVRCRNSACFSVLGWRCWRRYRETPEK